MNRARKPVLALALATACVAPALAGQIHVFAPSVVRASIGPLIEKFEADSGDKVEMTYGGTGLLLKKLADGEKADIVVLPSDKVQAMAAHGDVIPATVHPIGVVGIGVAIKAGAPKPDIGSVEAFRQLLLRVQHVAAISPANSTSGRHVAEILETLHIKDQVQPKMILVEKGYTAEKVASGEADIAIQQITEILPVKGAQLVGPLPPELQETTIYTVAVRKNAPTPQAATRFAAVLASPAALQSFQAHGFAAPPAR